MVRIGAEIWRGRIEGIATDEQKQYISLHLDILKKALKDDGLCFVFLIDKTDFNKSYLAIADVESIRNGKVDGMKISLEKLNDGLL